MHNISITTNRLMLREYQEEDWEQVHVYTSVPEFTKYEVWGPNTVEQTKEFVQKAVEQAKEPNRIDFELAICLKDSHLQIGGCGIHIDTENPSLAAIGWAINPEYQNKGYATEAARVLIDYGFDNLSLGGIYAFTDVNNMASVKVMEKLGMTFMERINSHIKIKGKIRNSFRYQISSEDRGSKRI